MPKICFVDCNGAEREVAAASGLSLMQAAVRNGVAGIDADCGGNCVCGTCHVIVEVQWYAKVGEPNPEEKQMLALNPELAPTSRLACQVRLDETLDGLRVRLPQFQM